MCKLKEHQLYANIKISELEKISISYLGHMVSNEGVGVDKEKVHVMVNWPQPQNLSGLREFLELTDYYRRLVANYAQMDEPLTQQFKKDSFGWSEKCNQDIQSFEIFHD